MLRAWKERRRVDVGVGWVNSRQKSNILKPLKREGGWSESEMDMEIDEPQLMDDEARPLTDDALFRAAEAGKVGILRQLSGEEIDRASSIRNEDGRSLLHVAASAAQTEVSLSLSLSE